MQGGKLFDFNEQKIFFKFDLFCKRLTKLHDMFTTIHQFTELSRHTHIDGLEDMVKTFFEICDEFKRKPYDMLDYMKSQFDRDYLEFNVQINDLETALQAILPPCPALQPSGPPASPASAEVLSSSLPGSSGAHRLQHRLQSRGLVLGSSCGVAELARCFRGRRLGLNPL